MSNNSVVMIGNNRLFRLGLKPVLHKSRLVLVGEGDDILSAFRACKRDQVPGLVIFVDHEIANIAASIVALRKARQIGPETLQIVVSDADWTQEDRTILRYNIDAVLSPTFSCKMLANAFGLIMAGHRVFARSSLRRSPQLAKMPPVNNHDMSATLVTAETALMATKWHLTKQELHNTSTVSAIPMLSSSAWKSSRHLGTKPNISELELTTPHFSLREHQTLQCLVIGKSNKSIATTLSLTETAVKAHVKSLLRKLKVVNRTQAAIWAINNSQICNLNDTTMSAIDGVYLSSNDSVIETVI